MRTTGMRKAAGMLALAALASIGAWSCSSVPTTQRGGRADAVRPASVAEPATAWTTVDGPNGTTMLIGHVHAPTAGSHPAVLLVPGSEGLNANYAEFARELATYGFDVAFGCWFNNGTPAGPGDPLIPCEAAPTFQGVTDAAVKDLNALVTGARAALGNPKHLALLGFSRGGGLVMLRASTGAPEPVISIAGMLEGVTAWGEAPGEVNVVARARGVHAPVLILHGLTDDLVPVKQAKDMVAALEANGVDVASKYYERQAHGLATVVWIRHDMEARIAEFLCDRFGCGLAGTEITGRR